MWNFKGDLWNSTQIILPMHWKMQFLYNIEILRALGFKSSSVFLKRPPATKLNNALQMRWEYAQIIAMAAIFQTTFSNAFYWMKIYKFRLKFLWTLFPRAQLTIFQQRRSGDKPLSEPIFAKVSDAYMHIYIYEYMNTLTERDGGCS